MNLLQRISLCLLRLTVHKKPPYLTRQHDSTVTPLGQKSYRDVNTHASLDKGVRRARDTKCYSPRVEDE